MSFLHDRIAGEQYNATPGYHPVGTEVTPQVAPLALVTYTGTDILYGTLHPLYTADGAVVPAHADVTYPTVHPAGRS